jgi:hypothetical protein
MSDLSSAVRDNGTAKALPPPTRVRHGLIEDWRDGLGILLLLLVAAFFGALIARFWPEGDDSTKAANDAASRLSVLETRFQELKSPREMAELKDRMTKLEARVGNAETAVAAVSVGGGLANLNLAPGTAGAGPTPGTALSTLTVPDARKQIDDLAARLTAVETKTTEIQTTKDSLAKIDTGMTGMTTRIDTLAARLTKVESADILALARRASFANAVANLSRAAQGSAPFKVEYDVVAAMVPEDEGLKSIAPAAAKGVPTAGTLIATFGNAADAAVDAENAAKANDWSTKIWTNFTSLVSSRVVGETQGASTESRIARAEVRLKAGDLAAAVRELNAVTGPARKPLTPWLNQAQARVQLEKSLADLNMRARESLAAPIGDAGDVPQLPTP